MNKLLLLDSIVFSESLHVKKHDIETIVKVSNQLTKDKLKQFIQTNQPRVVLGFPTIGKSYFAQLHPDSAIDIESSDYFFDKTGYEHLSTEEFKGIKDRVRKETGLEDYMSAIEDAYSSNQYQYIFTSQSPDVVKALIAKGYKIEIVKWIPSEEADQEFIKRAKQRGNNNDWINSTRQFMGDTNLNYLNQIEKESVSLIFIPYTWSLSDYIETTKGLSHK